MIIIYHFHSLRLTSSSLFLLSWQLFQYFLLLMNEAQKQENLEHIHGLLDLLGTNLADNLI